MPRDKLHLLQLCTTGSIINNGRIKVTGNLRSEDKSTSNPPTAKFQNTLQSTRCDIHGYHSGAAEGRGLTESDAMSLIEWFLIQ